MGLSGFTFALPYAPGDQPFQRPVVTALRIVNFARIGLFLQTPLPLPLLLSRHGVQCTAVCGAPRYTIFPPDSTSFLLHRHVSFS
jgi:hypothetical protein